MQEASSAGRRLVILGTGGTIAGAAASAADNVGYTAGQRGVGQLAQAVPTLANWPLDTEQVAQLDSKDMGVDVWRALAQRVAHHLARAEVGGIVVTHGTDTMEETAWFLQRVLAPRKPVVLVGAMRPATSLQADGPQNLADAATLAMQPRVHGVLVVLAGNVHGAREVRKVHPYRLDAFGSGDAGPLARIEQGRLRWLRALPGPGEAIGVDRLPERAADWPAVEIVASGVQPGVRIVEALADLGVRGIVAATTGNGSLHVDLEAALVAAQRRGVAVLRATRCTEGPIVEAENATADPLESAVDLTPAKARIELMLRLLGG